MRTSIRSYLLGLGAALCMSAPAHAGAAKPITYDEFERLGFAFNDRCQKPWLDAMKQIQALAQSDYKRPFILYDTTPRYDPTSEYKRIEETADRCVAMLLADWYIVTLQPATFENFGHLDSAVRRRCEKIEPFYSIEQAASKALQREPRHGPKWDAWARAGEALGAAMDRCTASVTGFSRLAPAASD